MASSPQIRRSLFMRFFLFLSKTEEHVLDSCTKEAEMTQASIGAMVLFTGLAAFMSMFFAINMVFETLTFAIPVALLYSVMIMTFDREIVSIRKATWKSGMGPFLLRFLAALIIAVVVSFPIELKLFEGRIKAEISLQVDERNKPKLDEITRIENTHYSYMQSLKERINTYDQKIQDQREELRKEIHIVRYGPRAASLDRVLQESIREREKLQEELNNTKLTKDEKKRIEELRAQIQQELSGSTDLLSLADAFAVVTAKSEGAAIVAWFVRLFFVLLEIFPIFVKLLIPTSEYQTYMDRRREVNVKKLDWASEKRLKDIQEKGVFTAGVTELFDDSIEDGQSRVAQETRANLEFDQNE